LILISRRSFPAVLAASALPLAALTSEKKRKKAPDFELKDSTGATVRLADFKDKVVLLDFWATWCVPCKTEIPWFVEFADKYKKDGLVVLGVSMDEGGWPVVKPFVDQMKINYPIVLGTKRTAYLYGDLDAYPVTFLVDRTQRVASIHLGLAKKEKLEKEIRELLGVKA
jgi:peroxiredoxin